VLCTTGPPSFSPQDCSKKRDYLRKRKGLPCNQ